MTMLYKSPGRLEIWGVSVDHITVAEADVAAKLADGWSLTVHGAEADEKARLQAQIDDNERKQTEIEKRLSGEPANTPRAIHRGAGKWDVIDGAGNALHTRLTKEEALALAPLA